jgi:16S rRNA (cytosine1402-N4)-methyltransferase
MYSHYPVLHKEILGIIKRYKPSLILDCTFGLGGHSSLILANTNAQIIAIDCDPQVIPWVEKLQQQYPGRLIFINKKFSEAIDQLMEEKVKFDWVVGDFGLSSMQIDNEQRGFSFTYDGPLAMDMDQKSSHRCQQLINYGSVKQLSQVIEKYGQEKNYYHIVKNIIAHRPIHTTGQLRQAIAEKVYDKHFLNKTLSRVFQAIRIYTNNEMEEIHYLLKNINKITHDASGFCWIYFHSLEGDQVHQWEKGYGRRHAAQLVVPSQEELDENTRSRSAKMLVVWEGNKHLH